MKYLFTQLIILLVVINSNSQTIFTEGYSSSSLWYELDESENQINFSNGMLVYNSTWSTTNPSQANARIYKSLGSTLRATDKLKVDIDFKISSNFSNQNGLILFSLCQNTEQPFVTRNSVGSYDCKKNSSITVLLGDGFISLQLKGLNSHQPNSSNCPNAYSKDMYGLNLTTNTKYYLRYSKQQNAHKIQIFMNPQRIASSKIFDTLLCSSIATDSMKYIMHGNHSTAGWDRTFEVSLDSANIEKTGADNSINCGNSHIDEESTNNLISIYPNPTSEYIIVESNNNQAKKWEIQLCDLLGQQVLPNIATSDRGYKLDIRDVSKGIYKLLVLDENSVLIKSETVRLW